MVFPFLPCSSMCVCGQTGSGKTRFVYRILQHVKQMYANQPPDKILYCFGILQPLFDEMEKTLSNITFLQGLPTIAVIEEFSADRRHRLIVLDDLMHRVIQDVDIELLFTQDCHYRKLSVIFITQNIFPRGSKSRTITFNTIYMVLMKDVIDVSQVTTLGRQLFPGRSKVLTLVTPMPCRSDHILS